jgi:hypothetical protein
MRTAKGVLTSLTSVLTSRHVVVRFGWLGGFAADGNGDGGSGNWRRERESGDRADSFAQREQVSGRDEATRRHSIFALGLLTPGLVFERSHHGPPFLRPG